MRLTVKYFGYIAESTGKKEEVLEVEDRACDLEQLKELCSSKYGLSKDLNSVQVAVNQSLISSCTLKDGDEVAFLPPFAGG